MAIVSCPVSESRPARFSRERLPQRPTSTIREARRAVGQFCGNARVLSPPSLKRGNSWLLPIGNEMCNNALVGQHLKGHGMFGQVTPELRVRCAQNRRSV